MGSIDPQGKPQFHEWQPMAICGFQEQDPGMSAYGY